jgi:hypothetical protein
LRKRRNPGRLPPQRHLAQLHGRRVLYPWAQPADPDARNDWFQVCLGAPIRLPLAGPSALELCPTRTGSTTCQETLPHPPLPPKPQYVSSDGLGVGGSGHWAVFLDDELLRGSSGECATFGSPCLAAAEDFEVLGVELWRVH